MNRKFASTAALALGLTLGAAAQTVPPASASPAASPKIAVISFQLAVAQTNEGQRSLAEIEKKYDPKRQKLKAQSDELDALNKQLQTQNDKLSDTERASRAKTIEDKKKIFDRDVADAKNDFQTEMQDMISGLASKVYDVLAAYAQKQGYTLVLDESQQGGPVLIASPKTDITKAIIEAYNVKSGVPAPPAAAAPSAAKPAPQSAKPAPQSAKPAAPAAKTPAAH
jgi:outer membrane protein